MKNLAFWALLSLGLLFLLPNHHTVYAQSSIEKCQQGACTGFGPPSGSCVGAYAYSDLSQTPPVFYSCKGGAWVQSAGTGTGAPLKATTVSTASACNNGSNPAVCGSAAAGLVLMPVGVSTLQVNTTAITANSQVFFTYTNQCGTLPTNMATVGAPYLNGVSAGASFNVSVLTAPATNAVCLQYLIVN